MKPRHVPTLATSMSDIASVKTSPDAPADVHVHRIGSGAILDSQNTAATRLGVDPDTVVLVRPDGYIAARVPLWEAGRVRDHLRRLTDHQPAPA